MTYAFNFKAFKALVQASNLSREKIAEDLEISVNTLDNWRLGRNFPQSYQMPRMAKYFGVDLEDLWITPDDFHYTEEAVQEILSNAKVGENTGESSQSKA